VSDRGGRPLRARRPPAPERIPPAPDPYAVAAAAATALRRRLGHAPDVAVVLGSGWAGAEAELGRVSSELAATDLPGFPVPTAPGHRGALRAVVTGTHQVLVLSGRLHLYEGHSPAAVVHAVRTAVLAGARTVLLTNAAGALRPELAVGRPVLIADQLNLTGRSPLTGAVPPEPHPGRFLDVTGLYDPGLRAIARDLDPGLVEGVYAGLAGPQYETPAEVRMLRRLGADVVGMSTVLEAIAAHHLGARVLGLALVTNPAAGLAPGRLDGDDVLRVAAASAARVGRLLADLIGRLAG